MPKLNLSPEKKLEEFKLKKDSKISPINPHVGLRPTLNNLWSLALKLAWWVGLPGKWTTQTVRLVLFATCMLPGLLPEFYYYLTTRSTARNVAYGPSMRHQVWIEGVEYLVSI
jgi:hypothetical protein